MKETQNEPKRHLTSAERQAIYEQHAKDKKLSVRGSKRRKKVILISLITLAVLLIAGIITTLCILEKKVWGPAKAYAAAEKKISETDYLGAYRVFKDLGGYSDAAVRAQECILLNAKKLTGRDDALISNQTEMPWFSIDETGTLKFDKDVYNGDGNIVIPDIFEDCAVTAIADSCFFYGDFLKSVSIPATVIKIGDRAFFACTSLTTVTLPDSVTTIGEKAFSDCTSLKDLTLSKNLTTCGDKAFSGCTSIEKLELPEGFREIRTRLFNGCTSLKEITIPSTVTLIGNYAFTKCDKLEKITFNGTIEKLKEICTGEDKEIVLNCPGLVTK